MRLKMCKRCHKQFETDRKGVYMCPSCSAEIRRGVIYRQRVCMDCGTSYMGYPKSKRCQSCQRTANRERERRYHATGPARHIGDTDICQSCGTEYVVQSGRQRYCKACAESATKANVQSARRDYMRTWVAENVERRNYNRSFNKVCRVCGKVFDTDTPTVTCSPECAKKWTALQNQKSLYRHGKRITPPGVKYESNLPKSGVMGVTARRNGRWQATWKRHYIGVYATIEEAAVAIEDYKKNGGTRK